jgi:hypothetical protein
MFRQQRSSGIELLECLIDQSIMRRLNPFIGVVFGTHAVNCTGRIRTRWCSTQVPSRDDAPPSSLVYSSCNRQQNNKEKHCVSNPALQRQDVAKIETE